MIKKETKRKILVTVLSPIIRALNRDLSALHVKRDIFLSQLFDREIAELDAEVKFRTPDLAKKAIKHCFNTTTVPRESVTLVIDRDVDKRMREILSKKNVTRNAFINRVLYLLLAKPVHLKKLNIAFSRNQISAVKPLDDAWSALNDPFFNIRAANDGALYSLLFPDLKAGKGRLNPFGLNCAIGPEDWAELSKPIDDSLLLSLGI
ncbi:MAG: hypothetical protein HY059_14105 [Proteobacteria bacterium]|nr:hypothetical protein [Pseudomonadota bacterium]